MQSKTEIINQYNYLEQIFENLLDNFDICQTVLYMYECTTSHVVKAVKKGLSLLFCNFFKDSPKIHQILTLKMSRD